MITYQLIISESFPKWHSRAGEPTKFREQLFKTKLHTFREDYAKWQKRFEKIDRGEAYLSVRVWAGVPYRSMMKVVRNLGKDDGIGLQLLQFHEPGNTFNWLGMPHVDGKRIGIAEFANNDGLTVEDWIRWLTGSKADLTKDFALIQLTDYRYN